MPNPQTLSSVFCDDGAAPPPSVVLAAQTDLRADAVCVSLAAYENLSQYQQRSGGGVVRTPRDHLHRHVPYRVPSNGARERQDTPPATAPQDVPQTEVPVHEIPPMPPQAQIEHAREHVATETTASAEKPTDIVQIMEPGEFAHHPLIQKPRGYAGRSGSGGYNVQDAMGWNDDRFAVLKARVRVLADEHLDSLKSYKSQNTQKITLVRKILRQEFPGLERFVRLWPVTDLLQSRLKYTSEQSRMSDQNVRVVMQREAARRAEEALRVISEQTQDQ